MSVPAVLSPEMKLEFHYRGLDVDRGRMSATDLGPAIFGIGKAFGETSRLLYGDDTRIRVDVRADFEHASFGIEFVAVALPPGLLPALTLSDLANVATILGFLGASGFAAVKGVLWVVRQQAGRKVVSTAREGDTMNITFEGNVTINITINEYKAFVDPVVRDGLRAIVAPLAKEGIDSVDIQADDAPVVSVVKREVPHFSASALPDEEVSSDVGRAVLEVVSPVFREGNSWKFAQGGVTFWAKVDDSTFLAEVGRHGKTFGRGDALVVELETRTTRVDGVLKFERRVLRVLDHIHGEPGGDQLDLV